MNQSNNFYCNEKVGLKTVELVVTDNYQGTELKTPNGKIHDFDESMISSLFDSCMLASTTETLSRQIIETLSKVGKTLSVAESLTGGALASSLVGTSGASKVLDFGIVSYSNKAKNTLLDVTEESLSKYGAVSKAVAMEMAKGVLKDNDYALSTTGIAGPTGDGICEKVGTVFIGLATKNDVCVYGFHFEGTREEIRKSTIQASLSILLSRIMLENQGIKN